MKNYKFVFLFMFLSYTAFANDISVSGVSLIDQHTDNHYTMVQFNVSWNNSWRTSSAPNNWDAAWVFVKYKVNGETEWKHATLNLTGHNAPLGSTITPAPDGTGAFIYRDADGSGNNAFTNVQLRWNYGSNGVGDLDEVTIKVFAIEMVYVPQGSFFIGSGGEETSVFFKYPSTTNPYQITSEGLITVGTATNNLYYSASFWGGDQLGNIPAAFPKGFNAFYCMKYEIIQQQYVDFLNTLTQTQADNRKYDKPSQNYRYEITGSTVGSYTTANPFVACNWLSWADLAAYLDWSGFRPMTEIEFEKACRGTVLPVPNEYAWGTIGIAELEYTISNSGGNNENITTNYSTTVGNAAHSYTIPVLGSLNGPVRAGIFAGNSGNTGRVTSGATYYGIMEMSGNLWERTVTIGNDAGRTFTGSHGNGTLDASGNADVLSWPGTNAIGVGFRGGRCLMDAETDLRVSDRVVATHIVILRINTYGGRGVRTAP